MAVFQYFLFDSIYEEILKQIRQKIGHTPQTTKWAMVVSCVTQLVSLIHLYSCVAKAFLNSLQSEAEIWKDCSPTNTFQMQGHVQFDWMAKELWQYKKEGKEGFFKGLKLARGGSFTDVATKYIW